jgi:thiol:disulfide interchange protein
MVLKDDPEGARSLAARRRFLRGNTVALTVLLALIVLGAAACSSSSGAGGGGAKITPGTGRVEWTYHWQGALSQARSENKPIMVHFFTDRCSDCWRLETLTFTDAAVADMLNRDFIAVKMNTKEVKRVAEYYHVLSIPTDLFITPDGQEIGRKMGYRPPSQCRAELEDMLGRWRKAAK